jgi:sirohydrochlorin cobaltochelatase
MKATGIILLAHGARDVRWAEPFERLRGKVEMRRTGARVALAYLEFMSPDLGTAVDDLVRAGCRTLRIVPVFFGQGGHVRQDLPVLLADVAERHPTVAIESLAAVGEYDAVLAEIAEVCVDGLPV